MFTPPTYSQSQAPGFQPLPPQYPSSIGNHQVIIAILLSMLFPGLGQLYNKQTGKGFTIIGVSCFACCFSWVTYGVFFAVIWLTAFIDAIMIAGKINRGQYVMPNEWF